MSKNLEYIDTYFRGPGPRDAEAFEKRILEDPEFAADVTFYLGWLQAAKDEITAARRDRFREYYRQDRAMGISRGRGMLRVLSVRSWVAAAILLVVIGGVGSWYFLIAHPGPRRLADQYIREQWQTLPIKMGAKEDSMQVALRLYNEGQFSEAARRFAQMIRTDSTNYEAREYAAMTALRMQDYDQAVNGFRQLAAYKGLYANPAPFYLSLTLLKRDHPGDREEAHRLLQQVVDEDLEGKEIARRWLHDF